MQYTVVQLNDNSDNGSYDVVHVEATTPGLAYAEACKQGSRGASVDNYCGGPVFAGWHTDLAEWA